jgi:thioester reductase-like protein
MAVLLSQRRRSAVSSIFLTGFPGFLGSQLVERLLGRSPSKTVINSLIQPAYRSQAEQRKAAVEAKQSGWAGRICLYDGDITLPDLGLGAVYAGLAADTQEIYHLAAVYDLGVKRELAMRVNVDGTRNLLAFARACLPNLQRFQYVSTCYVSGTHRGEFTERDLVKGQRFNNYYEETKHLAEVDVQREMAEGLPCTIYRPSIVTGDSETGATQKYDGVYYLIRLMLRQRRVALIPIFGNPKAYEFNMVPREFVTEALAYLSTQAGSIGKVYQLCDPNPPTVDELIDITADATRRRPVRVPLREPVARWSLEKVGPLRRWTGVEPATVHYFEHPARYSCENTLADLEGTGVACPPFASYVHNLVDFVCKHPEITPAAMV